MPRQDGARYTFNSHRILWRPCRGYKDSLQEKQAGYSFCMSDYKHWKNHGQPGQSVFVTSTALDFVHAFAPYKLRDLMAASLLDDCRKTSTIVHAFVVMPHHIHFLGFLTTCDSSNLVQRIKSNSAKRILPLLPQRLQRGFDQQRGLNRRTFWKDGFRGPVVTSAAGFQQRIRYTHFNPVKANLCEAPSEYRWSSAWAYEAGLWSEESGLDLSELIRNYAPGGLPPVNHR